ncbi:F390 synthetase-related protein [Dyella sp.]|uniref:F390 synthetase-related protein n=1 Tax=Dyella sp. TaxID=1869338 RepID=UPI002ED66E1E
MSRLRDGLALLRHYVAARGRLHLRDRDALRAHQERRWRALATFVTGHSPFYASYAGQSLEVFPVMDKAAWMAAFNRINTVGLDLDDAWTIATRAEVSRDFRPDWHGIAIGLSTGTSGARGVFLASRHERLQWAAAMLARMLPDGLLARARIALLLRAGSNLYDTLDGGARLSFRYVDLTQPFADVLAQLAHWQPSVLVGPPSVLALVADAVRAGRLHLAPARVVAAAEVLDEIDERRMRETFGVRIEQIYQATEGFLGTTCVHGTLHLHEDVLLFEKDWIDREGRRFAPVVTDLYRRTQPVIRYRLNDVLVERATPCPCGSPFTGIERIEGREDDILWLRHVRGQGWVPVFADVLSRALLQADTAIVDYRIEQRALDHLHLAVEPAPDPARGDAIRAAIRTCIARLDGVTPALTIDGAIDRRDERKCRRVRRLCGAPDA